MNNLVEKKAGDRLFGPPKGLFAPPESEIQFVLGPPKTRNISSLARLEAGHGLFGPPKRKNMELLARPKGGIYRNLGAEVFSPRKLANKQ